MLIQKLDVFVDGDNITKKLKLFIDEQFRTFDIFLYFVPVVGEIVYCSDGITLEEDGTAEYAVPGDVLNGEGYFAAQIVGIFGGKIAKSEIFMCECHAKIDDNSAILPTGEVITLAQLKAQIDALTASEVAYSDPLELGLNNVRSALDYALLHGGGGSSTPVYTLYWFANPTPEQETANLSTLNRIKDLPAGSFRVFLSGGNGNWSLESTDFEKSSGSFGVVFSAKLIEGIEEIYILSANGEEYYQDYFSSPEEDFDPFGAAAGSMSATATYISERIGTSGNLDPDSYALKSTVAAINAKIPSAASPSNQLADKDFVNSSVATNTAYFIGTFDSVAELEAYSGTLTNNDYAFVVKYNPTVPTEVDAYDRYKYNASTEEWIFEYELNNSSFTAAQWAAINSAITASKVTGYDAHVADTTIHVTAADKTAWNSKYTKPVGGIPETDLASDVRTSLAAVADKQDAPAQVTSGTSITLADNTEYRLDNVTTLTLAYPSGNFECWLRISTASSGTPSITFPQSSSYIGSAPTFGNGETWELSIKDGVVVAGKVTS